MKKLFPFFFIMLLLLQSGGIIAFLKWQQFSIQLGVQKELENDWLKCDTLVLSVNEYKQALVEDEKEIRWQNKLYDIKSIQPHKGKLQLLVYHDANEENVILRLASFIRQANSKQKQIPSLAIQLLALTYIQPVDEFHFKFSTTPYSPSSNYFFSSITHQAGISAPPPKLIS